MDAWCLWCPTFPREGRCRSITKDLDSRLLNHFLKNSTKQQNRNGWKIISDTLKQKRILINIYIYKFLTNSLYF